MESTRDPRLPEAVPSSGAGDGGREGGGRRSGDRERWRGKTVRMKKENDRGRESVMERLCVRVCAYERR